MKNRRSFLAAGALCALLAPGVVVADEVISEKKVNLRPAHSAKKFSKQNPIKVVLTLAPPVVEKAFGGTSTLKCYAGTNHGSDEVKMKFKLERSLVFIDQEGNEISTKLSARKKSGKFAIFEEPLPNVDLPALGTDLEALIVLHLKLLKRGKIDRVVLNCEVEA